MLLRKSVDKTKNFFRRTLQNLKSFFFGGYQKLPRAPSFNPFSCSSSIRENHQLDHCYVDFSEGWESDQGKEKNGKKKSVLSSKEPVQKEDANDGSFTMNLKSPVKSKQEEGRKQEKEKRISHERKKGGPYPQKTNEGAYALAQKMKELEMMDVGNLDHVLDVEEVLHYYSRLKSPEYLDIVDKFFVDMYSEFSHPKAPISVNNSKRRLGPLKL